MPRSKVVLTDQVFPSLETERRILLAHDAALEVADGTLADVLDRARDADALLTTYFPLDRATIESLEKCRVIARYGIGVDNVDLQAARERGIVVTNVPDYSVQEVASHTLALLLMLLRRIPEADAYVRDGGWAIAPLRPMRRISTLTIGLVGYGKIAQQLAEWLRALGARVVAYDPFVKAEAELVASLDELLRMSDAVSLHAPLTPGTQGMIGADQLSLMQPHAVLVNTSRGGLLVLDDLVEALRAGTIRAAGLDTFDREPVDASRVQGVPNLVVTPHMAYYSEEAILESQTKATSQIVKVLAGETPDYPVN